MLNNHAMPSLKQEEIQLCLFGQARNQLILDVSTCLDLQYHASCCGMESISFLFLVNDDIHDIDI